MQVVLRYANGDVEHRSVKGPLPNELTVPVDDGPLAGVRLFRLVRCTLGMHVYEECASCETASPSA